VALLARSSWSETLAMIQAIEGMAPGAAAEAAVWVKGDISTEADCQKAVADTVAKFGPVLHILVNNAASFIFHSVETARKDWDEHVAVNIKGHALLTKGGPPRRSQGHQQARR
jgi:NAD(P)-dependent dehydrogenase (short-subunit alcohol dehydrogenase family)